MRQFELFLVLFMAAIALSCGVFLLAPIPPMMIAILISLSFIYLFITYELVNLLFQTRAGRFLRCLPVIGASLVVIFFVAGAAFASNYYAILGILAIFLASLAPPLRLRILLQQKRDDVIDSQYAYGIVLMLMSTPALLMGLSLVLISCMTVASIVLAH
jgi:hypothetical protein